MTDKIVLIRPSNDISPVQGVPLGLLHVGTVLDAAGYRVEIIDANYEPGYLERIAAEVTDALLVGLTCLTSEVSAALLISEFVKLRSTAPVIWGGWHTQLFPEQVCADAAVDFACAGEGEDTVLHLAEALRRGLPYQEIDGLACKVDGEVRVNPQIKYVDLEALPPIKYDLVDLARYAGWRRDNKRDILYQSSRGCPYRCKFCINGVTGNQKMRYKSAPKVLDELEGMIRDYGIDFVSFVDDNFFTKLRRSRDIIQGMIDRRFGVKWFGECRIDYFRPGFVDAELLGLAQRSGLTRFTLGAESGSQRILDKMGKDLTVEQILDSARALSPFRITGGYSFIIGVPGETYEDIAATVKLAAEVYRLAPHNRCSFNVLTPYPRSELTDELISQGAFRQPDTLRGWQDKSIRELYYARSAAKPWHTNAALLENIVHYGSIAYRTYSYSDTQHWSTSMLKRPWWYRGMLLVKIAQFRMHHMFFGVAFDKWPWKLHLWILDRKLRPKGAA